MANDNQLCLYSEASIKIPELQGLGSFWVAEHRRCWESGVPEIGMEALCPFLHTLTYASFPSVCSYVVSFYNKVAV